MASVGKHVPITEITFKGKLMKDVLMDAYVYLYAVPGGESRLLKVKCTRANGQWVVEFSFKENGK